MPIGAALIFAAIMLIISIVHFCLGLGIWKKKNLSRWGIATISLISIILAILAMINTTTINVILPNIILILISGTIIYYLLFTKISKRYFR